MALESKNITLREPDAGFRDQAGDISVHGYGTVTANAINDEKRGDHPVKLSLCSTYSNAIQLTSEMNLSLEIEGRRIIGFPPSPVPRTASESLRVR